MTHDSHPLTCNQHLLTARRHLLHYQSLVSEGIQQKKSARRSATPCVWQEPPSSAAVTTSKKPWSCHLFLWSPHRRASPTRHRTCCGSKNKKRKRPAWSWILRS